jgi:hypothetical protein
MEEERKVQGAQVIKTWLRKDGMGAWKTAESGVFRGGFLKEAILILRLLTGWELTERWGCVDQTFSW